MNNVIQIQVQPARWYIYVGSGLRKTLGLTARHGLRVMAGVGEDEGRVKLEVAKADSFPAPRFFGANAGRLELGRKSKPKWMAQAHPKAECEIDEIGRGFCIFRVPAAATRYQYK